MSVNSKGEPESNYFKVSHITLELADFKTLKPTSQLLYFWLCKLRNRYARHRGNFIRSDRQLIIDTGLSQYSISHAKRELRDKRFIDWVSKRSRRTKFHIWEREETLH